MLQKKKVSQSLIIKCINIYNQTPRRLGKTKFQGGADYWKNFNKEVERAQYKDMPLWYTFVLKWFLNGLNGLFGVIKHFSDMSLDKFYKNNVEVAANEWRPVSRCILPNPKSISFVQRDTVNCGVCSLLFMVNLIVSQVEQFWEVTSNAGERLPTFPMLGTTFCKKTLIDDYNNRKIWSQELQANLKTIYEVFQEELVILMERIRFL